MSTMRFDDVLRFELIRLNDYSLTVGALLAAIVIVLIGTVVSAVVQRGIKRAWARRSNGHDGNLHALLRLGHYGVMLVAIGVALETVGVDLSTLFAAGAIVAIGIGFAMQNVAQNFVSGVILLLERTIRPGDLLEVDGNLVRVERLGMRSTLARTRLEEQMIVPNSLLVQSTIKNYTLHDRLYRIKTSVGVAYNSDMRLVRTTLEASARAVQSRYEGRDPLVLLAEFGDSSVNFDVIIWTDDPWSERRTISDLNEAVWWALHDAGITIAFPQRDVHFDPRLLEALAGRTRGEDGLEAPRR